MLATALIAQIAAFTGQPVDLDPRLAPPDCAGPPAIAWLPPGRSAVSVTCAAPGWRLFVPVAAVSPSPPAAPLVRRGDVVAVSASGDGFRITVDAVAESDAATGERVRLRNKASGERLQAIVGADGNLWLTGFNGGGGSR
jgi:flagella basal body P-ring formation protein FlgA